MSAGGTPGEAARFLRQRLELGEGDVFLEGLDRDEALALLAAARAMTESTGASERDLQRTGSAAGADRRPKPSTPAPPKKPAATTRPTDPSSAAPRSPAGAGADAAASTGGPSPRNDLPVLPDDYGQLRDLALQCTRCGLSESRTQVVFSDGVPDARLMVVGEAPGANEDATGLPFVGAAGRFLDLLLACVDLSREESVYIANVLKCRPPGNRNPLQDEIDCCSPYLRKQIELVAPQALLAVGTFAGQLLTGRQSTLGRLRGTVHAYEGVPLVVTYHPAALLRNSKWTRPVWDDLQLLRGILDGG